VSEIVLNEHRIRALVGQSEAASVAQHMRMGKQGQGSGGWGKRGHVCRRN
jgi:hypothetical protein